MFVLRAAFQKLEREGSCKKLTPQTDVHPHVQIHPNLSPHAFVLSIIHIRSTK